METPSSPVMLTPRRETFLLLTLAIGQFTHILDFVIMMPLGPQLMRVFQLSASQFGFVVSAYTFSAAIAGLIAAFFLDRFDRKQALILIYVGFTLGTLLCAQAHSYEALLLARIVAGAFGGIMNAIVYSIVGDLIPQARRGQAMGIVMSAFSVAAIVGVPLGLFLANHGTWQTPFQVLSGICVLVGILYTQGVPPVRGHLTRVHKQHPLHQMREVLRDSNHWWGLSLTMTLVLAGFSVIPYLSPYMVHNVGLSEADLPYLYFCGGCFTIFTSRSIGRLADQHGKQRVFRWVALGSIFPILAITNLPPLPLWSVVIVTTLFMILVSGRFVPAMAIITACVHPHQRGSFMSINSCFQQFASGMAATIGGFLIGKGEDGALGHYWLVGIFSITLTACTIFVSYRIQVRS